MKIDNTVAPKPAKHCGQGAIGMVNGKAKLLREDYCNGLGSCLPACPTGAISFETREAAAYDEAAEKAAQAKAAPLPCGCPGSQSKKNIAYRGKYQPHRHGVFM